MRKCFHRKVNMIICAESHQQFQQSANNQSDDGILGFRPAAKIFDNDICCATHKEIQTTIR